MKKSYLMRVDSKLFEKLQKKAEKEGRSINKQIEQILKKAV